jgi:surface antigen
MALAAGQVLIAGPAGAQVGTFGWSPNEPRLTQDDKSMLWQSADALNEAPSPQSGESRTWSNPRSGNSGQVTLVRVFRSNDMPCHALHYSIMIGAGPTPRIYDLSWCRTPEGQWKILG